MNAISNGIEDKLSTISIISRLSNINSYAKKNFLGNKNFFKKKHCPNSTKFLWRNKRKDFTYSHIRNFYIFFLKFFSRNFTTKGTKRRKGTTSSNTTGATTKRAKKRAKGTPTEAKGITTKGTMIKCESVSHLCFFYFKVKKCENVRKKSHFKPL